MALVTTYVFLDLETSSLPEMDLNKTRITEISLIAVKREHLLDTRNGAVPRVQHKLTLCINPCRMISPEGSEITGLCNDLLEFENPFNMETFNTINSFLGLLGKPVCLVAYNGLYFDYPILKAQLDKLNISFFEDLLCADAYHAFYYILQQRKSKMLNNNNVSINNSVPGALAQTKVQQNIPKPLIEKISSTKSQDVSPISSDGNFTAMQAVNETTPKRKVVSVPHKHKKCTRRLFPKFPWGDSPKPVESFKLKDLYKRVLQREAIEAHRAENDCILMMEVVVALAEEFVEWVDTHHIAFSDVNPMRPGVPIGH